MPPPWPYASIVEDPEDHPNWVPVQHAGSGTPGLLTVEWEGNTGQIRVTGPKVVHNPPHAPAP